MYNGELGPKTPATVASVMFLRVELEGTAQTKPKFVSPADKPEEGQAMNK